MHICNVKIGCGCFVICQLAQDICWLIGQKQFSDVHRPFLKNFKGWTDTASDGEFNQSLQFCRSGDANMNWDINAGSLDRIGPLNDRFCLESKLGSNSQFGVGSLGKFLLPLQCCIYILGVEPSGSMSLLPSGWPAMCRRLNPALSKRPVSISCIELSNSPCGVVTPPAKSKA